MLRGWRWCVPPHLRLPCRIRISVKDVTARISENHYERRPDQATFDYAFLFWIERVWTAWHQASRRCFCTKYSASPVRIASGGNHTLVLMSSGILYSTGGNKSGQCCLINQPRDLTSEFVQAGQSQHSRLEPFKLCSATWEASILVSVSNSIFTSGRGSRGELGQGDSIKESRMLHNLPQFPPENLEVTGIASCMSHTVVVLSNGAVYGGGAGRKGQLGQPALDCWSPRLVEGIPFKARRVACGKEFTYIVGTPQDGEHLILGSNKWSVKSAAPERILNWKDIGASWGGIYVLLDSGIVLAWGRNDQNQLPSPPLHNI